MMSDVTMNLKSFQLEHVAGESEQPLLLNLRCHSKGLVVNACAHAVFFCKLLNTIRQEWSEKSPQTAAIESIGCNSLKVGIIGGGHIGKQLVRALLDLSGITAQNIHISTRRPEILSELQQLGVECFYDNGQLVSWADVVFLCCLPSHLLHVCSGIRATLREPCLVYSLVSAVPLPRLKQLLSYSAIVRPQYQCASHNFTNEWRPNGTITAALQDPAVVKATCPGSPKGKVTVNAKWLEAVFYAALNSCMWQHLSHQETLKLLNSVCFSEPCHVCVEKETCPLFVCGSFVNQTFAASLTQQDTFPWFDLTTVQLKETPFGQLLARCVHLQNHLAQLYHASFEAHTDSRMSLCPATADPSMVTCHESMSTMTALDVTGTESLEEVPHTDFETS
ncbi:NADP-dependent oxidoreductase domain-containing protein 1 [Alligator sinensis]|uniref:NADP-dependent oxidoreductase domain-containing protein 1 n=1 Tax=Alligator sinensis TaxID=38654 RepID=A0A3Q0FKV4_ALLSI|nr:NADP-dependent oxidoreductase domain-containing protein 1 [Alligator sinensis]